MQTLDYQGRTVVITGAASGIGLGLAQAFAAQGARLELVDRNAQALAATVEQLSAVTQVHGRVLDLNDDAAVADYASYRLPDARVICVTNTSFFSDGSIFAHMGNASTLVPMGTPPEDIAAMVEYYGTQTNGG
ncbi:MAG: hypothetical protein CMK97_15910 [Pseudomonas sp.]|nr:hypothetical protein [Pseudomonas sp.]